MEVSSPVRLNGLSVGTVTDIYFHPQNMNKIIVKFTISDGLRIPNNTIAQIYNADIMGTKALQLVLGDNNIICLPGDTLLSEIENGLKDEVNKQVLPLKNKAEDLISSIDSVMTVITTVLDKDARNSLTNSLLSLNRTFNTMELAMVRLDSVIYKNDARVSNILLNVESITTNLHNNNELISNVLANLESLTDSLAKSQIKSTINNVDSSLYVFNKILTKIDNGEGSIGLLLNNKGLYENLENSSKELELLIADMKSRPKRYVSFSLIGGTKTVKEKTTNK
jgi:phospholipid/cholesterol/gamma-HCH transport system substrate-binding protein